MSLRNGDIIFIPRMYGSAESFRFIIKKQKLLINGCNSGGNANNDNNLTLVRWPS
jgi:hypothetical protein